MKREEDILNEMMEIVSKRDSLVKIIEEDRLRCCHNFKINFIVSKHLIVTNKTILSHAYVFLFILYHIVCVQPFAIV